MSMMGNRFKMIPCFATSFERDEGEKLIGGPPSPDQEHPKNVISVFINSVIDPENPFGTSDAVRILLLQFSSLLVEQASHHIHDAANKSVCRLTFSLYFSFYSVMKVAFVGQRKMEIDKWTAMYYIRTQLGGQNK